MKNKKVLAVTGIRSEYDILYPVLKELRENNFDVKIVVSSAHLSDHFGSTIDRIIEDGFEIADRIDTLFITSRLTQRAKGTGLLIYGLTQTVEREEPDFLLVVGDREESIATAIVGNYMDKLVIHIGGGDSVFGNADDPIRFATSKLAHIHCCFSQEYANNLINISEESFRVFYTGNPAYVNIDKTKKISLIEISKLINIDLTNGSYLLVIKHPLSSEVYNAYNQMKITLEAVEEFCEKYKYQAIVIPPNSDPGSEEMRLAITEYSNSQYIHSIETLPRTEFINIVRHCKALVGNSSMGVLEAPFYHLPVVNIGNRQKGRLNAGNVEFINYDKVEIISSLKMACLDEKYRSKVKSIVNPFGGKHSAENVRKAIESINLDDKKWRIKTKLC
jgi:GDP/UDP-N,N'-diacetylbacillosamine 2-epimerase (hydrolysing)